MVRKINMAYFDNFEYFFEKVIHFITNSDDFAPANDLVTHMEEHISLWLKNPPQDKKDFERAEQVMLAIIKQRLPEGELYYPLKTRLAYLRGLIHEHGFGSIKAHPKQALIDYEDSAKFGNIIAWEKLGDMHFANATNEGKPVSKNRSFEPALLAYSNGNQAAKNKRAVNCYQTMLHDAIGSGHLSDAVQFAETMLAEMKGNKDLEQSLNADLLRDNIIRLTALNKSIHDAERISAKFIIATEASTIKEMEAIFLSVREELENKDAPNPVFDYYYGFLLASMARLAKYEKLEKNIAEELNTRSKQLLQQINEANRYPNFQAPLVDFVNGLALFESQSLPGKSPNKEIKDYLTAAAKNGCYIAYSYLGNLEDPKPSIAEPFYAMGAAAGDPRCQFTYYHRFLHQQIVKAFSDKNSHQVVSFCERTINLLQATIDNPFTISKNKPYLKDNLALITRLVNQPEILQQDKWSNRTDVQLTELIKRITTFNAIPSDTLDLDDIDLDNLTLEGLNLEEVDLDKTDFDALSAKIKLLLLEARIKALHLVNQEAKRILGIQPSSLNAEDLKATQELQHMADISLQYLSRKKYSIELSNLAKQSPIVRLKDFVTMMNEPNPRIGDKYYLEYIDPLHRKPELFLLWKNLPTKKNYFEWLRGFDSYSAHVEQVIYTDKNTRSLFAVTTEPDKLVQVHSKQPVADGNYLFALDHQYNFLIASESKESKGLRHFQHSSFLNGESVIAAGEVVVTNGKISRISNASGHYLPNIIHLHRAVKYLQRHKMCADNLTVNLVGIEQIPGYNLNALTVGQLEALMIKFAQVDHSRESPVQVAQKTSPLPKANVNSSYLAQTAQEIVRFNAGICLNPDQAKKLPTSPLRYHSSLPTVAQAKLALTEVDAGNSINPQALNYLSDHLPLLATIPIDDTNQLRIISWNMLVPNQASGFSGASETVKASEARAIRSITALIDMLVKQKPDALILQECYIINMPELKEQWESIKSKYPYELIIKPDGKIIIYNTKTLTPVTNEPLQPFNYKRGALIDSTCVLQGLFKHTPTNKKAIINNIHFPHEDLPYQAEGYVGELLAKDTANKADLVIVGGDFNNRYAPSNSEPNTSIVSNVVAEQFRSETIQMQGCDYTDGFFYRTKDTSCKQPMVRQIDPFTGSVVQNPKNHDLPLHNPQRFELERQRPILSCDESFKIDTLYAPEMKSFIDEQGIKFGMSSSAMNNKMAAIYFPSIPNESNQRLVTYINRHFNSFIRSKLKYDQLHQLMLQHSLDVSGQRTGVLCFLPVELVKPFLQMLDVPAKISAFTKIYQAIVTARGGLALQDKFDLSDMDNILKQIQDETTQKNPLVMKAWELANQHTFNCTGSNPLLIREIYQFIYQQSGIYKLFSSNKLTSTNIDELKNLIDGSSNDSEIGQIRDSFTQTY